MSIRISSPTACQRGSELLFEVVSQVCERTSLVVTTHLPFESWTEAMGSYHLTGTLLDRLTHRVHILEANGESFSTKNDTEPAGLPQPANSGIHWA